MKANWQKKKCTLFWTTFFIYEAGVQMEEEEEGQVLMWEVAQMK